MKRTFYFLPLFILAANSLQAAMLYWTELGSIYRSEFDGSNQQKIVTASSANGYACGLAEDVNSKKLYWYGRSEPSSVETGHGMVCRMNMDGSGLENVISTGLGTITYGFALDLTHEKMYLGEHGQMKWANLDGSGLENLPITTQYSGEIEIDDIHQKIYFNENNIFEGIRKANLNGTTSEDVFSGPVASFALDAQNGLMYVGGGPPPYQTPESQTIQVVNLNGSGSSFLVSGITQLNSLELENQSGQMYWMTNSKIQRANLDGSMIEDVVSLGGSGTLGKEDMIIGYSLIPEPSTLTLLGIGVLVFLGYTWRRQK